MSSGSTAECSLDRVDQSRRARGRVRRPAGRGVEARQLGRAALEHEPVHRAHQLQGRLPGINACARAGTPGGIEHQPYRPTAFGVLGGVVQQVLVER